MPEFSKNEMDLAAKMDEMHWRAWLPVDSLATGKKKTAAKTALSSLVKKEYVESKEIKDEVCYRLTTRGRKLLRVLNS